MNGVSLLVAGKDLSAAQRATPATVAPHAATEIKYRPDIDGLRAIAVLSVVVFHLFPGALPGGFVGVDIFFVISGYLISSIILSHLDAGNFSFADFYARRVRRIFPALVLVLAATGVAGYMWLPPSQLELLGKHVAGGAAFSSNLVYLSEYGYFDASSQKKYLLNLWSLGVEEQFYIVWPLVLWAAHRFGRRTTQAILALAAISFFICTVTIARGDAEIAFYSPVCRFWELLLGALLAGAALERNRTNSPLSRWPSLAQALGALPDLRKSPEFADMQSVAGMSMIVLSIFWMDKSWMFPGFAALLPTLGACCMISAGPAARWNRIVLSSRWLVAIGLISYPLYLWHWPLLTLVRSISDEALSVPALLGLFVASLLLAWATYVCIEKPIRFSSRGQKTVAALCAATLLVGVAGGVAWAGKGYATRFPPEVAALFLLDDTHVREWRSPACFLDEKTPASAFAAECLDAGKRPSVVLWGDSHAAAIYPGLLDLGERGHFGLSQFTASLCPPLLGLDVAARPLCRATNDAIIERIAANKPDVVVLHATWAPRTDMSGLGRTVEALRKTGVRSIVLIGPVPRWRDNLADDVFFYWKRNRALPPERMDFRLVHEWKLVDDMMRDLARENGVAFISAYDALCDQRGCVTQPDPARAGVMSFDEAHLSPEGARRLAREIEPALSAVISRAR